MSAEVYVIRYISQYNEQNYIMRFALCNIITLQAHYVGIPQIDISLILFCTTQRLHGSAVSDSLFLTSYITITSVENEFEPQSPNRVFIYFPPDSSYSWTKIAPACLLEEIKRGDFFLEIFLVSISPNMS